MGIKHLHSLSVLHIRSLFYSFVQIEILRNEDFISSYLFGIDCI